MLPAGQTVLMRLMVGNLRLSRSLIEKSGEHRGQFMSLKSSLLVHWGKRKFCYFFSQFNSEFLIKITGYMCYKVYIIQIIVHLFESLESNGHVRRLMIVNKRRPNTKFSPREYGIVVSFNMIEGRPM